MFKLVFFYNELYLIFRFSRTLVKSLDFHFFEEETQGHNGTRDVSNLTYRGRGQTKVSL